MARGGFCKLPDGTVVVALTLPAPVPTTKTARAAAGAAPARAAAHGDGGRSAGAGSSSGHVRVVVHAVNRSRALTRLRNLGLRSVYLRGNAHPPTPDEVTAVLYHPDGLIWRSAPFRAGELWHPIRSLFAGPDPQRRTVTGGTPPTGASRAPGAVRNTTTALPSYLLPKPLTVPEAWTASGA